MSDTKPQQEGGPPWAARAFAFILGCAVLAFGIALTVKTGFGAASWDVLHVAVAERLGITIGQANIAVACGVLVVTLLLGGAWSVRWGTIANTIVIGTCVDLYLWLGIPDPGPLWAKVLYLAAGVFCLALGSVLYTRVGFGTGTRDGLCLVLSQRLPLTVGRVRLLVEFIAALTGWALGGPVGVGTAVIVLTTGPIADLLFRVLGRGMPPATVRIPEPAARR